MKQKCMLCNNMAVWMYMPGDKYFCDIHVPRGCFCQIDENGIEYLDECGKKLPCIEYNYYEEGWEVNE